MTKTKTESHLGRRIAATLIDYVPFLGLIFVYTLIFGEPTIDGTYEVTGIKALVPIPFWFIYFPLIESFNGQTVGHKVMGLQVVRKNGESINLGHALARRIFDPLDFFSCFGLVSIILVLRTDHHQRIGDMVAGTIVVGGETDRCAECHEEMTLSPEETIRGKFECSECGATTKVQKPRL